MPPTNNRQVRQERQAKTMDASRRVQQHQSSSGFATLQNINLPMFKLEKGKNKIHIIPFTVSKAITKFTETIRNQTGQPGDLAYEQTYWQHPFQGINEETVICPRMTYGQRCPMCEQRAEMAKSPAHSKDSVNAMNSKERQIFLVVDDAKPKDGLQIMEISFHNFGKLLDARVKSDESGKWKFFADEVNGFCLHVDMASEQSGKNPYLKAQSIDFMDRKARLPASLYDSAPSLTDLIKPCPSYAGLEAILFGPDGKPGDEAPVEEVVMVEEDAVVEDPVDEEPENDTTPVEWEVGMTASFEYKDEIHTGEIIGINAAKGLAKVQCEGNANFNVVKLDELVPPQVDEPEAEAADEGWDDAPAEEAEAEPEAEGWDEGEATEPEAEAEADSGWDDAPAEEPEAEPEAEADGWGDEPVTKPAAKKPAAPVKPVTKPATKPAVATKPAAKPAGRPAKK